MKTTNLKVVKWAKNKYLVQFETHQTKGICFNKISESWGFLTFDQLVFFFGSTNHRESQRVGSSMSFAHRCRTTQYGALVYSASWDGEWRGDYASVDEIPGGHVVAIESAEAERMATIERASRFPSWELLPFSFNHNVVPEYDFDWSIN